MAIVRDGRIVDFSSEPGAYVFNSAGEPTIFSGPLNEGIYNSFEIFKRRFAYSSGTGLDLRASAQANAMEAAAKNEKSGAMNAFLGMNMAQFAGGMTPGNNANAFNTTNPGSPETWVCACGNMAKGNFCNVCGRRRP